MEKSITLKEAIGKRIYCYFQGVKSINVILYTGIQLMGLRISFLQKTVNTLSAMVQHPLQYTLASENTENVAVSKFSLCKRLAFTSTNNNG